MQPSITLPNTTVEHALVEPDVSDWNAFVLHHPRGHLLQMSGWGKLKSSFGWDCGRVALMGLNGLAAGAQVLFKRRFGVSVAYVPRGPLLSGDETTDRVLMVALDRLCRRNRAIFLRLEPNLLETEDGADALHSTLLTQNFQPVDPLQPRSSIHLDLSPEPDQLLANMSKGHRADVRRAAREGVQVRQGDSDADVDAFYAIMQSTSARAEFGIHSRDYYQQAWRLFQADDRAVLLLAEQNGVAVATAMMFADGKNGLYLYSGSTPEGLKSGAQHAIQWQAVQWARAHGCSVYDFWGIPDQFGQTVSVADETERMRLETEAKSDPLYGVYRFKKGFGGAVVRYLPAYDRVYVPPLYRLVRRQMA